MELHAIFPADIRAFALAYVAELNNGPNHSSFDRADALAVVNLLDILETRAGPTKWIRLNHFTTVSFFAYNQAEFAGTIYRQFPQLPIFCRARYSEVQFLLPIEQRPWEWAKTIASDIQEAADLVIDGLARCESRREYLVEAVS